ncbi:MAG: hypothetical protein QOE70_2691 [Chthoniobacter sp.]|jgi:hypothetical protein|nr:hypothetical protein [Chthoniobacter sp.]
MQTLVLRIPDDLAADIEAEARRLNSTKSEVARARLAAVRAPGAGFDLISDLVGAEKGGPADLSARKKQYLKTTGYGREKLRR